MPRKKKAAQGGPQKFDLGSRLDNVRTLVASNRRKEAIAYMFMIYAMMCGAKFKEPKKPSQSIRDYAMVMVRKYGQNPAHVYKFVEAVESVIYGGRQPSKETYDEVVRAFADVFQDLVGRPLPPL